jgi:hypothetical protein
MKTKQRSLKSRIEIKAKDFIDYSIGHPDGYTNLTAAHVMGFSSLIGLKVKDRHGKLFGTIIGQDKDRTKGKLYAIIVESKFDQQRARRILRQALKEIGIDSTKKTIDVIMASHPVFTKPANNIKNIKRG